MSGRPLATLELPLRASCHVTGANRSAAAVEGNLFAVVGEDTPLELASIK